MKSLIRDNPKVSSNMVFRHALKEDFSNYQSNIIVQNGNSEVAVKAAQALANKHPESRSDCFYQPLLQFYLFYSWFLARKALWLCLLRRNS
jgi:hypothetical protein